MNQHLVPKLIIEGFVDETSVGNRGVWVYQARHRQWAKRPTKRTASLDDFYSLVEPSGKREDAIDVLLQRFETPFALLLQKDIAARHPIAGAPHRDDLFIVFCRYTSRYWLAFLSALRSGSGNTSCPSPPGPSPLASAAMVTKREIRDNRVTPPC